MSTRDLIFIVVVIELLLHYLPWRLWIGKDLPRLVAYVLGLLGMMGPLSLWLMDHGEIAILETLWWVVLSAGGAVFMAYGVDHVLMRERESVDGKQLQKVMTKSLKDKGDGKTNT